MLSLLFSANYSGYISQIIFRLNHQKTLNCNYKDQKYIFSNQNIYFFKTKMNSAEKKCLILLSMGELLTCTTCLIFSWQILAQNPRIDNLPAMLGYIASIFGATAAGSAIYGTSFSKSSWLLVHCVISMVTMAILIPTISAHVYVLAAAADGSQGIIPEYTMFVTRRMAWRIATQIVLFAVLIMTNFCTCFLACNLQKQLEKDNILQQRFDQYIDTERIERTLRGNKDSIIYNKDFTLPFHL
jgi:hypothetical protein